MKNPKFSVKPTKKSLKPKPSRANMMKSMTNINKAWI